MSLGLGLGLHKKQIGLGITGLLDQYTGAAAAFSLDTLIYSDHSVEDTAVGSQTNGSTDTYTVRVRRSSDNAVRSFTHTEVGDGTLVTWVGAGNDGFVEAWYNQGSASDTLQTTAASQAKIVDAGSLVVENGKAALDFDGNKFLTESSVSLTQPFSYFGVRKYNNDGTNSEVFVQQNTASYNALIDISFISSHANFGAYINGDTETFNQTLRFVLANGVSSQVQDNAGTLYTNDGGTNGISGLRIGYGALTSFFESNLKGQAIVIYDSDQSSNRTAIESALNDYYEIY
jgi:hypothetical protein